MRTMVRIVGDADEISDAGVHGGTKIGAGIPIMPRTDRCRARTGNAAGRADRACHHALISADDGIKKRLDAKLTKAAAGGSSLSLVSRARWSVLGKRPEQVATSHFGTLRPCASSRTSRFTSAR